MYRHTLAPLSIHDTMVTLERHRNWASNHAVGDNWLSHIAEQYLDACEALGPGPEATRWNDTYQTIVECKYADRDNARAFFESFTEVVNGHVLDLNKTQLTDQMFDGGQWSQVGCARASCTFVRNGIFFAVWPMARIAKVFCEGFAEGVRHTNAPYCVCIYHRGVTYTATTLSPLLSYTNTPKFQKIVSEARDMNPKKSGLRKAYDGRWYAINAYELTPLFESGMFNDGVCRGFPSEDRIPEACQGVPPATTDIVTYLRSKKNIPCRWLLKCLPHLPETNHKRQILIEYIARYCKRIFNLTVVENTTTHLEIFMHANRMITCIGDTEYFKTIIMSIVTSRHHETREYIDLLTTDDAILVMHRFHELLGLRSSGGQVMSMEPRIYLKPVRREHAIDFKPYDVDFNYFSELGECHVVDMIECIHRGLLVEQFHWVKVMWKKLMKTRPPDNISRLLFDTVRWVMHPIMKTNVQMQIVQWFRDEASNFLPKHSPEVVRASDVLAAHALRQNQRVYSMVSYENVIHDILSNNTALFQSESLECIMHWLTTAEDLARYGKLVSTLVNFKTRMVFASMSSMVCDILGRCENESVASPTLEVLLFAAELALRTGTIMVDMVRANMQGMIAYARSKCVFMSHGGIVTSMMAERYPDYDKTTSEYKSKFLALADLRELAVKTWIAIKIQRFMRCLWLWRAKSLISCKRLQRIYRGFGCRLNTMWMKYKPILEIRVRFIQRVCRAGIVRRAFFREKEVELKQWRKWWWSAMILGWQLAKWAKRSAAARFLLQRVGRALTQRRWMFSNFELQRSYFFVKRVKPVARGYAMRREMHNQWRNALALRIQTVCRGHNERVIMRCRSMIQNRTHNNALRRISATMRLVLRSARNALSTSQLARVWKGYGARFLDMKEACRNRKLENHIIRVQRSFAAARLFRVFSRYADSVMKLLGRFQGVVQRLGRGLMGRKNVARMFYKRKYHETMLEQMLDRVKQHEEGLSAVRYHKHYHLNGRCTEQNCTLHHQRSGTAEVKVACEQLTERQKELLALTERAARVVRDVQSVRTEVAHGWTPTSKLNVGDTLEQISIKNAALRHEIMQLEKTSAKERVSQGAKHRPHPPPTVSSPKLQKK